MSDSLHDDQRAKGLDPDADRNVKIEQLLLSGLDHYFKGRYERAIDVWTRVLFLDRSHARARAYIERARAALAERLRESEELVHTGLEAFERGDVSEARSLLTSAVERGGGREEALSVLDRLDRLESAGGNETAGRPKVPPSISDRRQPAARISAPTRRVRVIPLVLFVTVLLIAVYFAMSGAPWDTLLLGRSAAPAVTPATAPADPLPIPSGAEVRIGRAQRLIASGRLHEALAVLDAVRSGDPLAAEADALRATVQRRLVSPPGDAAVDVRRGGSSSR